MSACSDGGAASAATVKLNAANGGSLSSDSLRDGKFQLFAVQPFGHQESIVVLVSRAPIELRRGIISAIDFQMDGIHAHLACLLFEKVDGLPAKAAASPRREAKLGRMQEATRVCERQCGPQARQI